MHALYNPFPALGPTQHACEITWKGLNHNSFIGHHIRLNPSKRLPHRYKMNVLLSLEMSGIDCDIVLIAIGGYPLLLVLEE